MIPDIENTVFSTVATALRDEFDGISNIFSTGFDEGFAVGVYNYFDSIYIYDVPSTVANDSVTMMGVYNHPNNEIVVTGAFIV